MLYSKILPSSCTNIAAENRIANETVKLRR